jgi:hypothetical protein
MTMFTRNAIGPYSETEEPFNTIASCSFKIYLNIILPSVSTYFGQGFLPNICIQLPFLPRMLYALPISSPWFHRPNILRAVQIIEVSLRIFPAYCYFLPLGRKNTKKIGKKNEILNCYECKRR